MGFAARTLTGLAPKYGRMRLNGTWLGLLGPMGPLPTHMTEAVYHERQFAKSHPLGDWLDLVAGRMLQLAYQGRAAVPSLSTRWCPPFLPDLTAVCTPAGP